jgi:hypothetical protein
MVTLVRSGRTAIAVLLFSLTGFAFAQGTPPDLILYNSKIFTSSPTNPFVQALAIRGERIVATGDSAKIKISCRSTHKGNRPRWAHGNSGNQ